MRKSSTGKRSPASFEFLFEANPQPLFIFDHKTFRFLDVNKAACAKYGYTRAEFLAMSLAGIENDNPSRHRLKGGRVIDVEVTRYPIKYRKRPAAMAVVQDVTERKRLDAKRERLLARERTARAEAEQLSRSKDEFLALISHELRTPLTAMLGWALLLREGSVEKSKQEQALKIIERNMRMQAQIIEDMLDVSRIITGKLSLELQVTPVAPLLHAAVEDIRPEAQAKGIRLESAVEEADIQVHGDPDRLQQVLWNLLSNAVKFTPAEGTVRAQLKRVNGSAEITISDTGKGINPGFLPYVFDRFRQEDSSLTRSHRGLGLGLAIVRHITELHGGSVRAASDGPGRGAAFTVAIPTRQADPILP